MDIERSPIYREILEIINSPAKPVHFTWKAVVHAGGESYPCLKVLTIDDLREFDTDYAETLMIEVMISLGTYAHRIYPNKDNLDITLIRIPIGEVSNYDPSNIGIQAERYTAVLVDKGNLALEANGGNTPTEDSMNLTSIDKFEFQLINKTLEQLRTISVGEFYRGLTVEDAVRGILTNESKRVKGDDASLPKGVEMVPASNKSKRDHIVIPHGMRLVNVPQHIHENCGGIYNAGLGYFYQDDYWYVYPCYDTTRFHDAARTMTVINVPQNRFPSIERTYDVIGSHLTILATGDIKLRDDSNSQQLNAGNGARFADANAMVDGFVHTGANKAVISRARNNSEFVSTSRGNGTNNVRMSSNAITANPYLEYSKMARRDGAFLSVVWEHSDTSLLFPGMMAKILYLAGEEIKEVFGSLLKFHACDMLNGEGMTSTRYTSRTVLVFFIGRPETIAA